MGLDLRSVGFESPYWQEHRLAPGQENRSHRQPSLRSSRCAQIKDQAFGQGQGTQVRARKRTQVIQRLQEEVNLQQIIIFRPRAASKAMTIYFYNSMFIILCSCCVYVVVTSRFAALPMLVYARGFSQPILLNSRLTVARK